MKRWRVVLALLFNSALVSGGEGATTQFKAVACGGYYPRHLQGITTNHKDAIFWSFTTKLVRTDLSGTVIKQIPVASHHGDLCFNDGKLFVAVNLGKFNKPAGEADSWVYVYDAESLKELARHAVPEAVHGAGGIAWHSAHFYVVGGLPVGTKENYIFEYDDSFVFQKKHVLASGYTEMGIQSITFADNAWWLGCYGSPGVLLKADKDFKFLNAFKVDCSLGIADLPDGRLLVASGTYTEGKGFDGRVKLASPDEKLGLRLLEPAD